MAKEVKKAQKKNVKVEEKKKGTKKNVNKAKKVVEAVPVETVKETTKKEEKIVVKKEKKNNNTKLVSIVKSMDDNRKAILFGIVGFLVATLLFRCILWPDRIATLADGTQPVATINGENYTADKLYEEMKEYYNVKVLLDDIDSLILTEKYPDNDDMTEEVKETLESYYTYYTNYGYTKEDIITGMGFNNEAQFLESLKLDYRRNNYYEEYVEGLLKDEDIQKYYDNNVFGDVDSKHILVKIKTDSQEGLSKDEANKLVKEIIKKLDSGKTWDEVITEYKDKIVSEDLGYQAFNASLEKSYLDECKKLEVGKYSKTPVLTSYGYHIVYKKAQKDTPTFNEVKDDIVTILANEKKKADENLYQKSLFAMREEAKLEFVDTVLKDQYTKLKSSYK